MTMTDQDKMSEARRSGELQEHWDNCHSPFSWQKVESVCHQCSNVVLYVKIEEFAYLCDELVLVSCNFNYSLLC